MKEEVLLNFFLSAPQACGYLADKSAISLFVDPDADMSTSLYSYLINQGFRRSADYVYRPHCDNCLACIPVRLHAPSFTAKRSQKRVWNKNRDLSISKTHPEFKQEHFLLYKKYLDSRHPKGDMSAHNEEQYFNFIKSAWCPSIIYEIRLKEKLLAVAITDQVNDGFSAFYTFFDPDEEKRSLGVFGVLLQIEAVRKMGMSYLYLGYWIKECHKMNYKSNYQPLEYFINNAWQSSPETVSE